MNETVFSAACLCTMDKAGYLLRFTCGVSYADLPYVALSVPGLVGCQSQNSRDATVVAAIAIDTSTEFIVGKETQHLRENSLPSIHFLSPLVALYACRGQSGGKSGKFQVVSLCLRQYSVLNKCVSIKLQNLNRTIVRGSN